MEKFRISFLFLSLLLSIVLVSGCGETDPAGDDFSEPEPDTVSTGNENRVFGEIGETAAQLTGVIGIEGLGEFEFNPGDVISVRDDIFREGFFSLFDVLVYLESNGQIEIEYYFDEDMNTYVISNLDGRGNWWYDAYYDGGWRERSVFRMDHYPYKDKMTLNIVQASEEYLDSIYDTYRQEVARLRENGGRVIVPEVIIEGQNEVMKFENVEIKAYNLRSDMFQPGVITAIDTILSLGEEGIISYDLQWYESIGTAGMVKSYWVDRINEDESVGRCGFVYEAGDERFLFFRGNHNHIPSDVRVINSPQYVKYFWICI